MRTENARLPQPGQQRERGGGRALKSQLGEDAGRPEGGRRNRLDGFGPWRVAWASVRECRPTGPGNTEWDDATTLELTARPRRRQLRVAHSGRGRRGGSRSQSPFRQDQSGRCSRRRTRPADLSARSRPTPPCAFLMPSSARQRGLLRHEEIDPPLQVRKRLPKRPEPSVPVRVVLAQPA